MTESNGAVNDGANGNGAKHIEVRNLWKVFGNKPERVFDPQYETATRAEIQDELGLVTGLRDVSFDVGKGQIFVVMGLSGSGKSTLVRCLIRLIESTRGEVMFDGEDIMQYSPERLTEFRRQKIAMVFQHYGLLPHRRALDNVAYGLEIRGMDKPSRYQAAMEALETVGLKGWEDSYPREMSGGMQQRVGLARALAVNSEVLLMDEPFSGLDPLIRREMQDELISLQREIHKTIVFITHDLNEALKLGDRIAIMRDGEIVQNGAPEEIVTLPADDYVTSFVQDVSRAKVIQAKAIMQDPEVLVNDWQGPRAALHILRTNDAHSALVIDRARSVKGMITENHAGRLARQKAETLRGIELDDVMTAGPDDYIEDLIPMAAQTEHPIAIVNEDGRLIGEVHRGALLTGMSEESAED